MEKPLICTQIPEGFFDLSSPRDMINLFQSPTLFDLPGAVGKGALFLSALLHGNETTSFYVIQEFLRSWRPMQGPRLLIFWGNIPAAAHGLRQMPNGPDFNRIWGEFIGADINWAKEILRIVQMASPYAGLDIHNTSGANPLFSCLSEINSKLLSMARAFAPKIFYSGHIESVLSSQINKICPAITLECGQSGNQLGKQCALEIIQRLYLEGPEFFSRSKNSRRDEQDEIYECFGKFQLGASWRPTFSGPTLDEYSLILNPKLESYNFQSIPAGTLIARGGGPGAIEFLANDGTDLTDQFVAYQNGNWSLKQSIVPAMISDNLNIIKSDCWGYLLRSSPSLLKDFL